MTATPTFDDFSDETAEAPGLLKRLVLGIVGWSLLFSAFGLWAMPGSQNLPELMLMKLGLSIFMLIGGLCCIASTRGHRG